MSSVARDPVVHVINNVFETTTAETAIKQWQLQCVGERDIGGQEITHQVWNFIVAIFKQSQLL